MDNNDTMRRLDRVTDAGLFERLATAVLREQDPRCRRLAHVGVNAKGKTVKSPSDGVAYISDEGSRRMVAVHHTTCQRDQLRRKWLSEPEGDLPKTRRVFHEQQNRIPGLQATLILTTNREPQETLIHDVQAAGHKAGIDVEIYTGSGIAHFLDSEPRGQWFRQEYLGVAQTQLSRELLHELSVKGIDDALPDSEWWVQRDFDKHLVSQSLDPVTFIVGESGMGKTVACRKCLEEHVADGGFGLMVSAEVLEEARSLAGAVDTILRELHLPLSAGAGRQALAMASEAAPLLVVVEDVNRSASPAGLLEKLVAWSRTAQGSNEAPGWRVLCPVWPRTTALLSDSVQESVMRSSTRLSCFTEEEGIAAVQRRRTEPLSVLEAKAIATALGHDPLLIALHGGGDSNPEPTAVIQSFLERGLARLAAGRGRYTAGEYWLALRSLSFKLLERKQLEPAFTDVVEWMGGQSGMADKVREVVGLGEIARLAGPVKKERVVFRHDRVRNHLLADAIEHALKRGELNPSVMSDPYFAEVIGMVLPRGDMPTAVIDQVAAQNPLALFAAMRYFRQSRTERQQHIIDASMVLADSGALGDLRNRSLRQAALRVLADCEGPHVRRLGELMGNDGLDSWALRARFRNGDLPAGIQLCTLCEPGVGWVGHVELIEHVLHNFRDGLLQALDNVLRRRDLVGTERSGALRLAGYASSPFLAEALQESWRVGAERQELLSDYLWACSQCCGEQPAELLGPILDEWAAMPEEDKNGRGSPRVRFGADRIRWAFRDRVPDRAIGYFLLRAMEPELQCPLLVMLNGIDDPAAVEFVVRGLARQDEEFEGTGRWSPFAMWASDEWSRRPKYMSNARKPKYRGAPMKAASRRRLRELWLSNGESWRLRRRALEFWCATVTRGDIAVLKSVDTTSPIGDVALFERLRRGDQTAIRGLLEKLEGDGGRYWWQAGRYLWSEELTECVDRSLSRLATEPADRKGDLLDDLWMLPELLMRLPPATAERLIKKHWAGLSCLAEYVQTALYLEGSLLADVREVVAQHDDPKSLFAHFDMGFGIHVEGRRGITRLSQMEALLPYLDYLADYDVIRLWEACNENGWFDWRRRHLDSRAKRAGVRFVDAASAMKELDKALAHADRFPWMDRWGENILKTGVSLDGVMELVKDWLEPHDEEQAFRVAVDLVTRLGRRRHLTLLSGHTFADSERGQGIIEDASFALRLRSLT